MIFDENNINIEEENNNFYKENSFENKEFLDKDELIDDKNEFYKEEKLKYENIEDFIYKDTDYFEENFNENDYKFCKEDNCKTIAISGNFGSGKSVISSILSKYISSQNKKTLLIDFDIINSSINTIFRYEKI